MDGVYIGTLEEFAKMFGIHKCMCTRINGVGCAQELMEWADLFTELSRL